MSSLARWNPFDEIASRWPRSFFGRDLLSAVQPDGTLAMEWSPRCDVAEDDAEIVVHAELPGVEAKDMEVTVHEGTLQIRGEKQTEKKSEEKGQTYTERFFGSFERRIALPSNVDTENVQAKLADGVLEVRIAKTPPVQPAARKIEIATS